MPKLLRTTVALALVLALLTGCAGPSLREYSEERRKDLDDTAFTEPAVTEPGERVRITNADLVYVRPDLQEMEALLDEVCALAQTGDAQKILEGVYAFYDAYDWFYTFYALADIRYSADLTDDYWAGEYSFCMDSIPWVDAALEEMYYALAASPARKELEKDDLFGRGFFDDYDGENLWDEEFQQMLERESELQNRYYELSEASLDYEVGTREYYDRFGRDMAQVLVDLITVRKEMATYWGYSSYPEFAWDFYYYRDFTPEQALEYYGQISTELVPLYRSIVTTDVWDGGYYPAKEERTFEYVRTAAEGMGGLIWEAFDVMAQGQLYDLTWSRNKYASSFVWYLTGYGVPFVFVYPGQEQYDFLTFAHEFGHFCSDYAAQGSGAGIDVGEIFSQGMEYLSLSYGGASDALVTAKLADGLATYVEQAAYGSFEQQMYALEGDELSVEGLCRLYDRVGREFGFDVLGFNPMEFVDVNHFYTNPMYVVSYVVSNDAALQLYQIELREPGAGVALLEEHLATEESKLLAFLRRAELESPFAPGRLKAVAEFLEEAIT